MEALTTTDQHGTPNAHHRFDASSSQFLETPAAAHVGTAVVESKQLAGHVLGHYTLKERIGIGGI